MLKKLFGKDGYQCNKQFQELNSSNKRFSQYIL